MRISDWSSDVCSSDLLRPKAPLKGRNIWRNGPRSGCLQAASHFSRRGDRAACLHDRFPSGRRLREQPASARPTLKRRPSDLDRKSVVSGKSVSVRVDPGGRRLIKKKQTRSLLTPWLLNNTK